MNKASSHAATQALPASEPLATLPQLGELVALMDAKKISRSYMQDFIRFRLTNKPKNEVPTEKSSFMQLPDWVEKLTRELYPHAVNEILEIVRPFMSPTLDVEFKSPPTKKILSTSEPDYEVLAKRAVFWQHVSVVRLHIISKKEEVPEYRGKTLRSIVEEEVLKDAMNTRRALDATFGQSAKRIVRDSYLHDHISKQYQNIAAVSYEVIRWHEIGIVAGSVIAAIEKAIAFAACGDATRVNQLVAFLDLQRSGFPLFHIEDHEATVHILCARPKD